MQTQTVPRIAWSDHLSGLSWKQGEHVTILGPTGSGKTTLALALLPKRSYVIALATKPRDDSLDELRRDGFKLARDWPPDAISDRMIIWPKMDQADAREAKWVLASTHERAMSAAFRSGGWCVYADELLELTALGLSDELDRIYSQGRSNRVSMLGGSQRPWMVPQLAYSQATHFYLFTTTDDRDVKRLSEISGRVDKKRLKETVAGLDWHDVLYANARTGAMEVTRVE